jgi:hypothetical protein
VFVSYVLRLRSNYLAEGKFVGEVEGVATGHRFPVRSVEQLVAFVLETTGSEEAAARLGALAFDELDESRALESP